MSGTGGRFTSVELCAGLGGQALGLERAGFDPVLLLDSNPVACETLRVNRPQWHVIQEDFLDFDPLEHPACLDVDLLSVGLPSQPYSTAGLKRGAAPGRDPLMAALYAAAAIRPKALLFECTTSLRKDLRFLDLRQEAFEELKHQGFTHFWADLDAQHFGVPQRRESALLVAFRGAAADSFTWPRPLFESGPTMGEALRDSMAADGWPGADTWAEHACEVSPTVVGGSKQHGGADLGPTGSKKAFARLGVNGISLGDRPPALDFPIDGSPRLTLEQIAILQGIPTHWTVCGGKTVRYRQLGNAMPPALAEAVGRQVAAALGAGP